MENKFTDTEIMKALGWLERIERDTDVSEWAESIRIILDDYNRQKAEIERLNFELAGMRGAANSYKIHYDNAKAEIERLKEELDGETVENMRLGHENEALQSSVHQLSSFISCAREQTIKEFAERLKEKLPLSLHYKISTNKILVAIHRAIDNLVKEITKGDAE